MQDFVCSDVQQLMKVPLEKYSNRPADEEVESENRK